LALIEGCSFDNKQSCYREEEDLKVLLKLRFNRYPTPIIIEFKSIEFSELGKIDKKNL
jgi:hypothetical protein